MRPSSRYPLPKSGNSLKKKNLFVIWCLIKYLKRLKKADTTASDQKRNPNNKQANTINGEAIRVKCNKKNVPKITATFMRLMVFGSIIEISFMI